MVLGYKLMIKRGNITILVHHDLLADDKGPKPFIRDLRSHVPPQTPNDQHQIILRENLVSRAQTDLSYIARKVSVKDMEEQNNWFFDLGVKS